MREIDAQVALDEFVVRAFIALIAFICLSVTFGALSVASAATKEADTLRVELVQNLAISPDAADYMHKQGSGLVFDDMSVE
jgi:hypothetical protein